MRSSLLSTGRLDRLPSDPELLLQALLARLDLPDPPDSRELFLLNRALCSEIRSTRLPWNLPLIESLLELGANPSAIEEISGHALLTLACRAGQAPVVELLLSAGADLSFRDLRERTAIFHAIEADHPDCLALLLGAGANPRSIDVHGISAARSAACLDRPECLRLLSQAGVSLLGADHRGVTHLMAAASYGHSATLRFLLDAGADPRAVCDRLGRTALHYAVMSHQPLGCELLLNAGADPLALDLNWDTPLDIARVKYPGTLAPLFEAAAERLLLAQASVSAGLAKARPRPL